jgi:hypothetical protein
MAFPTAAYIDGQLVITSDINAMGAGSTWIGLPGTWVTSIAGGVINEGAIDYSAQLTPGTKMQGTYSGTVYYWYVVSATGGGTTSVILAPSLGAGLGNKTFTNVQFSYAATPSGFPRALAWTPGYGGWAATPTFSCSFAINGGVLTAYIYITGTSSAGATTITLPLAVSASAPTVMFIPCHVTDNGGVGVTGLAYPTAGSATVTFYKDATGAAFTTSGTKTVRAILTLPI